LTEANTQIANAGLIWWYARMLELGSNVELYVWRNITINIVDYEKAYILRNQKIDLYLCQPLVSRLWAVTPSFGTGLIQSKLQFQLLQSSRAVVCVLNHEQRGALVALVL
jgi:hypothetical protein